MKIKSQIEREQRLRDLFQTYPETLFHGFGVADANLWRFPWFSVDTTSWILAPRCYQKVITCFGQKEKPNGWTVLNAMKESIRFLVGLESNYSSTLQGEIVL